MRGAARRGGAAGTLGPAAAACLGHTLAGAAPPKPPPPPSDTSRPDLTRLAPHAHHTCMPTREAFRGRPATSCIRDTLTHTTARDMAVWGPNTTSNYQGGHQVIVRGGGDDRGGTRVGTH